MLPHPTDPAFPDALKQRRDEKNLSYTEIAKLVGINPAMPSRYENRDHSCFCAPRISTWNKLNTVLYGTAKIIKDTDHGDAADRLFLSEASIEDIIQELRTRGVQNINISF